MEIYSANYCPYCDAQVVFTDSSVVYGKSYGNIYLCPTVGCGAYVGVHKKDNRPLGRLANSNLRELKKQAHHFFDNLWNQKIDLGMDKHSARVAAYNWLSKAMNKPPEITHIGMFNTEECMVAIELCRPYYKEI